MAAVVQAIAALGVAYLVTPLLQVTVEAFRAPSQDLQRENANLRAEVERLSAIEAKLTAFNVSAVFGFMRQIVHKEHPGWFYIVVTDLLLTNSSDVKIPIELRLECRIEDSFSKTSVAEQQPVPNYVEKALKLTKAKQFDRVLNLPERSSDVGFAAFVLDLEGLGMIGLKELVDSQDLPMWLQLQNTLTQQTARVPLNIAARDFRGDWKPVPTGEST